MVSLMFSALPVYNPQRDVFGGILALEKEGKNYYCEVSRVATAVIAHHFGYEVSKGATTKCICVSTSEIFDPNELGSDDQGYPIWQLEQILVRHASMIEKMVTEKIARGEITKNGGISIQKIDAPKLTKP